MVAEYTEWAALYLPREFPQASQLLFDKAR